MTPNALALGSTLSSPRGTLRHCHPGMCGLRGLATSSPNRRTHLRANRTIQCVRYFRRDLIASTMLAFVLLTNLAMGQEFPSKATEPAGKSAQSDRTQESSN